MVAVRKIEGGAGSVGADFVSPKRRYSAGREPIRFGEIKPGQEPPELTIDTDAQFNRVPKSIMEAKLRKVFKSLSPREQKVLRLRVFRSLDDRTTLKQLGQEYRVTRERIRQVQGGALRKIGRKISSGETLELMGDNVQVPVRVVPARDSRNILYQPRTTLEELWVKDTGIAVEYWQMWDKRHPVPAGINLNINQREFRFWTFIRDMERKYSTASTKK